MRSNRETWRERAIAIACGALLAMPGLASAQIPVPPDTALVNQTNGTPTGNVVNMNGPRFADDFVVPSGQSWSASGFDILGSGGPGGTYSYGIYPDVGGMPADLPALAGPPDSFIPPAGAINDFSIAPKFPWLLPSGVYWLVVWQSIEGTTPWGWRTQSPQSGYEAMMNSSVGGCPPGGWRPLSTCMPAQPGPDLSFRINAHVITNNFTVATTSQDEIGNLDLSATFEEKGTLGWTDSKGFVKPKVPPVDVSRGSIRGFEIKSEKSLRSKLKKKGKKLKTTVAFTFQPTDYFGQPLGLASTKTLDITFKAKKTKKKKKGKKGKGGEKKK